MLASNTTTLQVPPMPVALGPTKLESLLNQKQENHEVVDMLSYLDPDMDYMDWLEVGMAIHAEGLPCKIWDEWSKGGKKYQPNVCSDKWGTFNESNGISFGTLVFKAKQAGWSPNRTAATIQQDIQFISPTSLQGKSIPEMNWIVKDWIPEHCVTALYGDGGTGKSLLAMQLMTAATLGQKWIGSKVTKMKTFGLFCEDTPDELHRRQARINAYYNCDFTDLSDMLWYSGVGNDNTLIDYSSQRKSNITQLYKFIEAKVLEFGARLIVIDTAANTFGGNEIVRSEVANFLSNLNGLAVKVNGAVILCAHPSSAGMLSNRGDGGSTAWNNSVRARMYFMRPPVEDNASFVTGEDIRILKQKKANYSKGDAEVTVKWNDGVFVNVGLSGDASIDLNNKLSKARRAEQRFLAALDDMTESECRLSNAKSSSFYAPNAILSSYDCEGLTKSDLEAAMKRLFVAKQIKNQQVGKPSNRSYRIIRNPAAATQM